MIRVLVAEDSLTTLELLVEILDSDPEIRVVGRVNNGVEAVAAVHELRPDIVSMGIEMPAMDGLDATRRIMCERPTPIVIVSAVAGPQAQLAMQAIACGALGVEEKPRGPADPKFEVCRRRLLRSVKVLSSVRVITRRSDAGIRRPITPVVLTARRSATRPEIVAIGTSTGGPSALNAVLRELPGSFPVPIVIVQHMSRGFIGGLATWLDANCALRVAMAEDGERLVPGRVYVAPDDHHLIVASNGRAALSEAPRVEQYRPSASALFESVAASYGPAALAVIMTGMGQDGVAGLLSVHARKGRIVAQDAATSVVFGMPRAAILAGIVDYVLPLDAIGPTLEKAVATCAPRSGRSFH